MFSKHIFAPIYKHMNIKAMGSQQNRRARVSYGQDFLKVIYKEIYWKVLLLMSAFTSTYVNY